MRDYVVLLLLWCAASSFNLTKAVHIDDPAYLLIAEHILQDPWHPMSGELFWGTDKPEPIHHTNQPHLIPYYLALWMYLGGESEWVLHLGMSLFSLMAIVGFYRLTQCILTKHHLLATAAFCLGPVYLPEQNLMTDIPLTAFGLQAMALLFTPRELPGYHRRLMMAAVMTGFAILTKYTGIVFVLIMILVLLMRKDWNRLWVAIIPAGILILWSWFNYLDYGGIHFLQREVRTIDYTERAKAWSIGLGAICPFSIVGLPYFWQHRRRRLLWLISGLFAIGYGYDQLMQYMAEPPIQSFLRIVFFINGILTTFMTVYYLVENRHCHFIGEKNNLRVIRWGLLCWLIVAGGFIFFCAPFIAVRHYLPLIPVVLLALGMMTQESSVKALTGSGLMLTILLGVILAISDWQLAHVYRLKAQEINSNIPPNYKGKVWFVGHWGWQWYALKARMQMVDASSSQLQTGDLLIIPEQVEKQRLVKSAEIEFRDWAKDVIHGTKSTWVRTMHNKKGLYSANVQYLPWTITSAPLETFRIVQIERKTE